jgi:uncharacterized protein (DUF697 family)
MSKDTKAQSPDWDLLPASEHSIEAAARRCRKLVSQRAMVAAGVAMVPIPGLDWLTDIGVLVKLLPEINGQFGLNPAQIERLAPNRRIVVFKAINAAGGLLVGKLVTQKAVIAALKLVGVRLTTQQAAKFVPLAGQAVSAALTYSALRYVCEQHIQQCMAVCRTLALPAPVTADPAAHETAAS